MPKSKSGRKLGRNRAKCERYRAFGTRERNRARRAAKRRARAIKLAMRKSGPGHAR